tara:strand:+ start:6285 stop:7163 length:879 start_codon:yes stop_codon:yes gene_type:complete
MNMPEFTRYLKEKGYASTTINTWESIMNVYGRWLEMERLEAGQVTYNDMLAFMKHSNGQGNSRRTVQHQLNVIKHYYRHLIKKGEATVNPTKDIKIRGVKRKALYYILSPNELNQIYHSYQDETLAGKRNKVMLGLLIYQGVKSEEVWKLETGHVKLKEGKVEIPGGKKSNHRFMELESHQVLNLYDYMLQARPEILRESGKQTDRLFMSLTEGKSTISNLVNSFLKPLKKQHTQLLNAKQIRASVITKWLKTHNLREAQHLAGHRYISTTESYQQNDMEGLKEEINQYHPL